MRLAAKIDPVREALDTSLKSLVATLTQLDLAATLDGRARNIPDRDDRSISRQNYCRHTAIGSAQIAQTAEHESVVEAAVKRQLAFA